MAMHFNQTEMEQFCARTLAPAKMMTLGAHLAECASCLADYQGIFEQKRNYVPVVLNLSPAAWLKDEHLDYDEFVAYADGSLSSEEREMTELHLKLCQPCRADAMEFAAWYKASEAELQIRYAPTPQPRVVETTPWWRWLALLTKKPAYAFALVLAVVALLVSVAVLLKPNAKDNAQEQAFASPTPALAAPAKPTNTPGNLTASTTPSRATPIPIEQRNIAKSNNANLPVATTKQEGKSPSLILKDGVHQVGINERGELDGLPNLSPVMRQAVQEFLLSDSPKRPEVIAELMAENRTLRGTTQTSAFKLLSPVGVVIAEAQPVFQWQSLPDATAWRVYVSDARARLVAKSAELPAQITQWKLPTPLKRGESYAWTVGAIVNGEEVTAPPITEAEIRFHVLGETELRALRQLRQATDSHLALGVFYARHGMLVEAEREFQQLANTNPDSPHTRKLLSLIQAWR